MANKRRRDPGKRSRKTTHGKDSAGQPEAKPDKWTVVVLGMAKKEGHKILSDVQYEHIKSILKRLVDFGDEDELSDIDIKPIESFYEIREKGGVLERINLRVYFGTVPAEREVVIAKTYKKEDDGPAPRPIIILVEDRLEEYKAGGLQKSVSVYQEVASKDH